MSAKICSFLSSAVVLGALVIGGLVSAPARAEEHAAGANAQEALSRLIDGNARYVSGASQPVNLSSGRIEELSKGQRPYAIIVSCSDSRVPPEHVFNTGLGEIFVIRIAGNVVEDDAIASVEYAVAHLGTQLVVVMGHESCGAVAAAAAHAHDSPSIEALVSKIAPAVTAAEAEGHKDKALVERAVVINSSNTRARLLSQSELLRGKEAAGGLKIVYAKYNLHGGRVDWTNASGLAVTQPRAAVRSAAVTHDAHAANVNATSHGSSGASSAAAASIVSDGKYVVPALVTAKRSPFGIDAGKAEDYPATSHHVVDNGMLVYSF